MAIPENYTFPITKGIVGRAMRSGETQIVHDLADDPDFFMPADIELTGSDLVVSALEAVFERAVLGAIRPFAVYGEDRPDAGVGVNVRGPIQRIEH